MIYKLKDVQQSDKEKVRDLYELIWISHCIYIFYIFTYYLVVKLNELKYLNGLKNISGHVVFSGPVINRRLHVYCVFELIVGLHFIFAKHVPILYYGQ